VYLTALQNAWSWAFHDVSWEVLHPATHRSFDPQRSPCHTRYSEMNFITIGDRSFVEALAFNRMASMKCGTKSLSLTFLDVTRLDTWRTGASGRDLHDIRTDPPAWEPASQVPYSLPRGCSVANPTINDVRGPSVSDPGGCDILRSCDAFISGPQKWRLPWHRDKAAHRWQSMEAAIPCIPMKVGPRDVARSVFACVLASLNSDVGGVKSE
jgi:hypothetical protein